MRRAITGIDHVVIAVRDLDRAQETYTRLGVTLTPRGFHTLGSANHCIMFGADYVELLALPLQHPAMRYYADFLARGEGLAAVALASADADAAYAELAAHGIEADAPLDFSRPVRLPEGERDAALPQLRLSAPHARSCVAPGVPDARRRCYGAGRARGRRRGLRRRGIALRQAVRRAAAEDRRRLAGADRQRADRGRIAWADRQAPARRGIAAAREATDRGAVHTGCRSRPRGYRAAPRRFRADRAAGRIACRRRRPGARRGAGVRLATEPFRDVHGEVGEDPVGAGALHRQQRFDDA